ncbi:ADP-ribose pyrophosphatase [Levilactobacillus paucivorans]|uniref:ADP-ribose pyrophosphatase n=1 Tax=Levilactobacillus paucivorans TaxID=616990 RepID=A0A0R2LRG6_9LACO|nr:ADP-ribose pyrophosphatase [Levilactobacillus paucivorans]
MTGSRPLIVVGAAAFVTSNQQQLLLVKRTDNQLWGLPAGSKELNESLVTTAQRELHEETGLVGQQPSLLTVVSGAGMQYTYPNQDQIDSVTAVYKMTATGQQNVTSSEIETIGYFSMTALPDDLTPITKRILNELGKL